MLINVIGQQKESTCFEQGEVEESCSIHWQNELYIFGGRNEGRQIRKLIDHKLVVTSATLKTDHYSFSCSVMANRFIFLCFNEADRDFKQCRQSTGPFMPFSDVVKSNYNHSGIKISCSESKPFCL